MTRLHATAAVGLFSLLLPTLGAATSPVAALQEEPSDGPWTYLAIIEGRPVFIDRASIRRDADEDGREYIGVRSMMIEPEGATLVTLDTDCASGMQRIGNIVQEDAERNRTSHLAEVGDWGKTRPGQAADRIRQLVCSGARD